MFNFHCKTLVIMGENVFTFSLQVLGHYEREYIYIFITNPWSLWSRIYLHFHCKSLVIMVENLFTFLLQVLVHYGRECTCIFSLHVFGGHYGQECIIYYIPQPQKTYNLENQESVMCVDLLVFYCRKLFKAANVIKL